MKYETKLFLRVSTAVILLALPINIFEILLKIPTMYLSYITMKVIGYNIALNGDLITIGEYTLRFISACAATSAYYLLSILILLTKDIKLKEGIKMFAIGSMIILIMNLARVDILLIVLAENGIDMFKSLHIFFWEAVSSLFVAGVWIILVKMFKIKSIPIAGDIKTLYKKIKKS